jgi:hypothetical protein
LPLSSRARIEIYLPDNERKVYQNARKAFEREFLETFGGCTVIRDIRGLYLAEDEMAEKDQIVLIYTDTPFDFRRNCKALSKYTDELREVAHLTTEEESILIVLHEIYHSV